MLIAVYNFKGGEGKSKIAANLALTMGYSVVTNDIYSPIDKIFDEDNVIKLHPQDDMPDFDIADNIVFDFGGYPDSRVVGILEKAHIVIVPITNEEDNIQVGINTIDEISKYTNSIVIIANKTQKGDYDEIKSDLEHLYPAYPIFEIKKSTAVRRLSKTGKSIAELAEEGGLFKMHYSKIAKQFDSLISFINLRPEL
jgi:MinD-like ATPase involved in chromosome partitioning or flagellar assembly